MNEDRAMEQVPGRLIDEIEEAKDVQTGELGREPSPRELAADVPYADTQTGAVIQYRSKQYSGLRDRRAVIARAEQFHEPESLEARAEALGAEDMADDPDNLPLEQIDLELERALVEQPGDSPEDEAVREKLRESVAEALKNLSGREREIIIKRFGIGMDGKIPHEAPVGSGGGLSLDEVAADFGVTRERIRQIESKTLAKMRRYDFPVNLRAFLEED